MYVVQDHGISDIIADFQETAPWPPMVAVLAVALCCSNCKLLSCGHPVHCQYIYLHCQAFLYHKFCVIVNYSNTLQWFNEMEVFWIVGWEFSRAIGIYERGIKEIIIGVSLDLNGSGWHLHNNSLLYGFKWFIWF